LAGKSVYLGVIILLSVALIGGVSVVGVLQSTERVGTSGIVIMPPPLPSPPPPSPPSPSPPPPEPSIEIDVYSNAGCTHVLTSLEWGSIEAGSSAYNTVYIKNSGDSDVILSLTTDNWTPDEAEDYMDLSWDYDYNLLGAGDVIEVTLELEVNSGIGGIDDFSFDIIVVGSAT